MESKSEVLTVLLFAWIEPSRPHHTEPGRIDASRLLRRVEWHFPSDEEERTGNRCPARGATQDSPASPLRTGRPPFRLRSGPPDGLRSPSARCAKLAARCARPPDGLRSPFGLAARNLRRGACGLGDRPDPLT